MLTPKKWPTFSYNQQVTDLIDNGRVYITTKVIGERTINNSPRELLTANIGYQ